MEIPEKRAGRPRAFNADTVLEAAMLLFWEHGYEATSLAMLRDAMGLTPPQIYNAFTDKETLFRKALERYHQTEVSFALAALNAEVSTREAIALLLTGAATSYTRPDKPGGCLFISGALAASPQAQQVADTLKGYRQRSETAIAARLAKGQADGDLSMQISVPTLARYIRSVMHGMSVQAREGATSLELGQLAELALLAMPENSSGG
ncbi:TetR/AcrR family transcriptional regulator [Devosia sp.]|uniref:TetR/AcrR family transcriptional regulator n=1 Tax=Devosia sp. TaxID=1871048 RepID=UPI0032648071